MLDPSTHEGHQTLQRALRDIPEFGSANETVQACESATSFVRDEGAQVTKTEIVPITTIEDELRGVVGIQGNSPRPIVGHADLLKAGEAPPRLPGMVLRWIKAGEL